MHVRSFFVGIAAAVLSAAPVHSPVQAQATARVWRVTTYEHVDLWLHGFALLTSDSGHVPFFARNYRQEITALKRQKNVYTNLDANQQQLSQRFVQNPALANAQFLAMYFTSLSQLSSAVDMFIRADGNPGRASDPMAQQEIAILAQNFPSPADRNWVRLFVQSLQDEDNKFYHAYWTNEQQLRGAAFAQVNQEWMGQFYPKISRFLNNTQQQNGEIVLSLPLGGEGRTVNNSKQANTVAVNFPKTVEAANEALFGFVHEITAQLVDEAVRDNTTPAEQRSGATAGYTGNGAVRGGALLIEKTMPNLLQDYMRYYIRAGGQTPPAGDPRAAFEAAFPLPNAIIASLRQAIESVLGGI